MTTLRMRSVLMTARLIAPQLDRIAQAGLRLDNCHCTNALCTPSRATILTASMVTPGVREWQPLDNRRPMQLQKILQEAGCHLGLW